MKSDAAHELPSGAFFNAPESEPAQLPVPEHRREMPPRLRARHRLSGRVPCDFCIALNLGIGVEVVGAQHAQNETLRRDHSKSVST